MENRDGLRAEEAGVEDETTGADEPGPNLVVGLGASAGGLRPLADFLEGLEEGLDAADAEGLLGRLARRMHRIDVGTFDALFVRMARSYGPELGLPPGWSIADDLERERLCSDAVQAVLSADEPGTLAELLRLSARGRASTGSPVAVPPTRGRIVPDGVRPRRSR